MPIFSLRGAWLCAGRAPAVVLVPTFPAFDCGILGRVAQEVLGDRTLDALMAIALMLPVFFVSAAPCSRGHPAPQRLASPCTVRVHVCIGPGRGALTEAMLSVTLRTISS